MRSDLRDEAAAAEFDVLVAQTLPLIAEREPGTLQYAIHHVDGEPLARMFHTCLYLGTETT